LCSNLTVINNIAKNNGISHSGSYQNGFYIFLCDNCHFESNIAENNGNNNFGEGFKLEECSDLNFKKNTAIENEGNGIYLSGSEDNNILKNLFKNNGKSEINISTESDNNQFWLNIIYDESDPNNLMANYGTGNTGDNGTIGNYWGNYTGLDENYDNIGDDIYSNSIIDNHPIANEFFNGSRVFIDEHSWNDWELASLFPWCNGEGSHEDPYIASNLKINGSDAGFGIEIRNSHKEAIIKDSVISDANKLGESGLILNETNNIYLQNNTLNQNWFGIYMFNSHNNNVTDCTFINNLGGIYLEDSDNNTLTQNEISLSTIYGISTYRSEHNNLTKNIISNSGGSGIYLQFASAKNNIKGNSIDNQGDHGIYIDYSENTTIIGNFITNSGLQSINLTDSDYCRVVGNSVEKLIRKDADSTDCVILANLYNGSIIKELIISDTGDGGFTWDEAVRDLYWCSGAGKWNDPYIFEDVNFVIGYGGTSPDCNALTLKNVNQPFIIRNMSFQNIDGNSEDDYAVNCENVHNGTFEKLLITDDFLLTGSFRLYQSSNISVRNNNLTYEGLRIDNCWNNSIEKNWIFKGYYGIYISNSENNTFSQNSVKNCTYGGFLIMSNSENNLIYNNTIKDNERNAIDNSIFNHWNNSLIGNYWSNYTGKDIEPKDGIGDTPHQIPGSANSVDYKPISFVYITESDIMPGEIFGKEPPYFTLTIRADEIDTVWYRLWDGNILTENFTINSFENSFQYQINDIIQWDLMGNGSLTISFYANDTSGNYDYLNVSVNKELFSPIITESDITPGEIYGKEPPYFTLTIVADELDTVWYRLWDGYMLTENFTIDSFTNSTQYQIQDISQWDLMTNGSVIISFYANDSVGFWNFLNITVNKDIIAPSIYDITPGDGQYFQYTSLPPDMNITVVDPNYDTRWYNIENTLTNFTFTNGDSCDLDAWNNAPYGDITITFYANDSLGNIGILIITIFRQDPSSNNASVISNPLPSHNALLNGTSVELSVIVTDPDGLDNTDVTFFNASDDSIIGTAYSISSGDIASLIWAGLSVNSENLWYVVANDTINATQSQTWRFIIENCTTLSSGIRTLFLPPRSDFNISISLELSYDVEIAFIGITFNPTETSLSDALFFIDISINDTREETVNELNFKIQIDTSQYSGIKFWWFNESANGGSGAWEEISLTDLGNGLLEGTIDHASTFAITEYTPPSTPLGTLADDDDDDDKGTDIQNDIMNIIITLSVLVVGSIAIISGVLLLRKSKKK
ncbi:MAG: hypothetical protein GF383_13935, partial [Candidatus Lokiarchaeota archaeon]|nr:hypothetical protein [Candidatus Lokiarchaeota archaeon]MBD3342406.1 hypothetical protein [Candidatus Lokiarchaeota archaeon]